MENELLREFKMQDLSGKWVILKNNEIIEQNESGEEILKIAQKYNPDEIIITLIPSSSYYYF